MRFDVKIHNDVIHSLALCIWNRVAFSSFCMLFIYSYRSIYSFIRSVHSFHCVNGCIFFYKSNAQSRVKPVCLLLVYSPLKTLCKPNRMGTSERFSTNRRWKNLFYIYKQPCTELKAKTTKRHTTKYSHSYWLLNGNHFFVDEHRSMYIE